MFFKKLSRFNFHQMTNQLQATTILGVKRKNKVVMIGDGQISHGSTILKKDAKKIRKLGDKIIAGYAGSLADCTTLLELIEKELEQYPNQLLRACVNVAKLWRTDKLYRNLHADMVLIDPTIMLLVDGSGNVVEFKDGVLGIGSGGQFAQAAARALYDVEEISTDELALKAMKIASDLCIYTNSNFVIESLEFDNITDKNIKL
jgi:ATP-dependent HslUV protease subunit HslV